MRRLNQRQRMFVIAMLETGAEDYTRCATMAGYGGTHPGSVSVTGSRLAHNELVQAAIHEEAEKRLGAAKILAVSKLIEVLRSSTDGKVQLKAAGMILNRSGLHEKTEHKSTVEHTIDEESLVMQIEKLSAYLGIDSAKLIGHRPQAVDAEFVEHSSEGLEDLLPKEG